MISQVFVLSRRGDAIVSRDYMMDMAPVSESAEIFFRQLRKHMDDKEDPPPIFKVGKTHYFHVLESGMYFAAATPHDAMPSMVLELLMRLVSLSRDFCGVLSEESLRKNFLLMHELLDEIVDFGIIQTTSAEEIRTLVLQEPAEGSIAPVGPRTGQRVSALNAQKSIMSTDRANNSGRDEIFVDVIEKLDVLLNASGFASRANVDGSIMVKSYLTGRPDIKLALNNDLYIGSERPREQPYGYSEDACYLEDCLFEGAADLDLFESEHALVLQPSEGECELMRYRADGVTQLPFRVLAEVDTVSEYKMELLVKVFADYPAKVVASELTVEVKMPVTTSKVHCTTSSKECGQLTDYQPKDQKVMWTFKKVPGKTDYALKASISCDEVVGFQTKRELGPISLHFTLPMYNVSKLHVKYLQILHKDKAYNPYRWVRYMTKASSYVVRIAI
eukprot:jgi/Pico_ML_1/51961/g2747.t1